MGDSLKVRLAALERARTTDVQPSCGVVTFGANETPDAALERARMAGVTGGVLLVPETMTDAAWERMMKQGARKEKS